jgi:hypothetical protein
VARKYIDSRPDRAGNRKTRWFVTGQQGQIGWAGENQDKEKSQAQRVQDGILILYVIELNFEIILF